MTAMFVQKAWQRSKSPSSGTTNNHQINAQPLPNPFACHFHNRANPLLSWPRGGAGVSMLEIRSFFSFHFPSVRTYESGFRVVHMVHTTWFLCFPALVRARFPRSCHGVCVANELSGFGEPASRASRHLCVQTCGRVNTGPRTTSYGHPENPHSVRMVRSRN